MVKRKILKPFSEMSRDEKIAEARNSIANLSHPHNRYNQNCYNAIRRWRETLKSLGVTLESNNGLGSRISLRMVARERGTHTR